MNRKNLWRSLFSLLMLVPAMALAQLTDGKVYNIVNVAHPSSSMAPAAASQMSIEVTNTSDYNQLWYVTSVSDNTYRLRNLGTGLYVRSSKGTSQAWTMVKADLIDDNCNLNCVKVGDAYTFRAVGDGNASGYMHYASGTNNIVCWSTNNDATLWTFSEVAVSAADLEKNWEELENINPTDADVAAWENALKVLFADKACTQLNAPYSGYSVSQMENDANYKKLPATLKNMVKKMLAGGSWKENNAVSGKPAWDEEYAKRLRVQSIEPYCNKESAAQALGMNSHTNLNNPLGIYANARQTLYIMVEGTIKQGATLYLATWTGHGKPGNEYTEGVQLKEGLNVVPVFANNLTGCLNYVVQTFNSAYGNGNKARTNKLSAYNNLKVHIEGGNLNGFYNAVGDELWGEGDNSADWDYYAARAGQTDLTILGKYMTLQFPLFDELTEGNKGLNYYLTGKGIVEKVVAEWDNIMLWERMLMGLASKEDCDKANNTWRSNYSKAKEIFTHTGDADTYGSDYDDYYNVHGLAFGVGGTAYMYGGYDHSGYHYNTMSGVITNIINDSGSHWGPAHEIGHQHQAPFTLNGLTEVTNNLFSNVSLWYFGKSTSRVNGDEGSLENVSRAFNKVDGDFYTNNIWALTHMYYRLFLYYHVLGHNTSFYPRLYEMLRQHPMTKGYQQSGEKGLLHFYKLACDAAGEDLTEFFRAHGLLTPMEDRFVGDYANSIYNSPLSQVNAAIASVKAKGYKVNYAPIFINDGTGEAIIGSTGGKLSLYDGFTTADVGSYAYFDKAAGSYTYSLGSGSITLKGTGGIGYLVRDAEGKVLAFSNKKSMIISEDVVSLLVKEEASVEVMNADGTSVIATCNLSTALRTLIQGLLKEANTITKLIDDTNMKVGYYRSNSVETLKEVATEAQRVYNKREKDSYATAYFSLQKVLDEVNNNTKARVGIIKGSTYMVECYKAAGTVLSLNASKKLIGEKKNTSNEAQQWIFETATEAGTYYIKNKSTNTYIDALPNGKQGSAEATRDAVAFKILFLDGGMLAVQCQDDEGKSLNYNSGIGVLGWDYDGDENSWWNITAVELNPDEVNKLELETLIANTEDLLKKMGDDVMLPGALPLQVDKPMKSFYLSSNADQNVVGTESNGGGVAALLDGDLTTYFRSQYDGTPVDDDHYLQVDLGEGKTLTTFSFSYSTHKAESVESASPAPTRIKVMGSNDGENFDKEMVTLATSGSNALLPYTNLGGTWNSKEITAKTPYRYLRFSVTNSKGTTSTLYRGHYSFAMSEFVLKSSEIVVNSLAKDYIGYEEVYTDAAEAMQDASTVLANSKATADAIAETLDALESKYEALLAAYKNPTAINSVEMGENKAGSIYDLSGRRLQNTAQPGIYIINGKKHLVK